MNSTNNKIVMLICYYGEFPWYFQYFLHSCKFNPTIDFLIFSDNNCKFELPRNVTIQKKSLSEIKKLASEKLGFSVNIDFPYKLCDFRPAFGLIFSEFIKGYNFWGQSDIDIICGNIRNFITNELLKEFDFISVRHDYTTGCFALYRNNYLINNIFRRSRDYKKVFSNSKYFGFDEFSLQHYPLMEGKTIFEIETEIESFTHITKIPEKSKGIRAHFDFMLIEGRPGNIRFDNGRIIYKNKFEAILYHLYWLKRVYNPKKIPKKITDVFYISRTRIYSHN